MDKIVVTQLTERVSTLLNEKLGARGQSLEARVRRAGRDLPGPVRRAAKILVTAEQMADEPKMLLRLNPEHLSGAYDVCVKHLESIDANALKTKARFGFAASVILQFLVVCAATLAVLRWRGFT